MIQYIACFDTRIDTVGRMGSGGERFPPEDPPPYCRMLYTICNYNLDQILDCFCPLIHVLAARRREAQSITSACSRPAGGKGGVQREGGGVILCCHFNIAFEYVKYSLILLPL